MRQAAYLMLGQRGPCPFRRSLDPLRSLRHRSDRVRQRLDEWLQGIIGTDARFGCDPTEPGRWVARSAGRSDQGIHCAIFANAAVISRRQIAIS